MNTPDTLQISHGSSSTRPFFLPPVQLRRRKAQVGRTTWWQLYAKDPVPLGRHAPAVNVLLLTTSPVQSRFANFVTVTLPLPVFSGAAAGVKVARQVSRARDGRASLPPPPAV